MVTVARCTRLGTPGSRWHEPVRRGEIRLVNFDPIRGSEAAKRRPAVVVSNDGANTAASSSGAGVVTVVPLTSNVATVHDFQVLILASESTLNVDSKAQAEQVRAVDVQRLGLALGTLGPATMQQLDTALRIHLNL